MLLRRVIQHVKEQNWFAVVLDFCIVVVGILIAFQVTTWNESRQNNNQAERILQRLAQDFERKLNQANYGMAYHQRTLEASNRLITGIRSGMFDEEHLLDDVRLAADFTTPPSPSTAFQELVSSGKIDLVRDEVLRNALYEFNSYVSFLRNSYMQFTAPILHTTRALMPAKTILNNGTPTKGFEQLGRVQSIDRSVLLANSDILDSLQLTYQTHDNIHTVFHKIHGDIVTILTLIKEEREKSL